MTIENNLLLLRKVAHLKLVRDLKGSWCQGSNTYFNAIYDELLEVKAEIENNKQCFLEDELGDVLWNYICLLHHLEYEKKISVESVFNRVVNKYSERVNGINNGECWDDIKCRQKDILQQESQS
ncbi:MazG nucleotide pyrophosphohydrolase domain-containing protein [Photobacterium toruni]|uniref:MazG nucleotide pyrophosphohydrolase domain-containing protein n=1 Tax=Photobacterium toruni TaxID=1935446 RepID=UPI00210F90B2|nr:MazG nucleotide pyrophosphohydrolase domain-containing protein [Photobacterium toruni]